MQPGRENTLVNRDAGADFSGYFKVAGATAKVWW
jgi:hypothetical protein